MSLSGSDVKSSRAVSPSRFAFVRTDEGIAIRLPPWRLSGSELVFVIREQNEAVLNAMDPLNGKRHNLGVGYVRFGAFFQSQLLQERDLATR
jgi:hypothetical protein